MLFEEKIEKTLEKVKRQNHNPTFVQEGTYKCPSCGRYLVIDIGEGYFSATGSMLKGKCAGTIHKDASRR